MFLDAFFHRRISGKVVDLVIESFSLGNTVDFSICLAHSRVKVGDCDLRIGDTKEYYFAGNIGYRIYEPYRGHHYAYEACMLVMKYAYDTAGMRSVYITCSPENIASKKTIERLGGEYVETVNVPSWHWLYIRGEKVKLIYRLDLDRNRSCTAL